MWLPDDLEVVLAWQAWCDQQCAGCGQHLAESTDPELEGAYEVAAIACHACAAREQTAKKHKDADGLKLAVSLNPEAQALLDDRRADV